MFVRSRSKSLCDRQGEDEANIESNSESNAIRVVKVILAHEIISANLTRINDPLTNNFSLLQWGLILKRFEVVGPLLKLGADPNFTDGRSYLPLFIASRHGHEATVLALLKWGADVNGVEITKMTLIF